MGGCTLEAAEYVTETHFSILLALVNEALIKRLINGRFDLHLLLKQYLQTKLSQNDRTTTLNRLCDYFADFTHQREQMGDEKRMMKELHADFYNLQFVWQYCNAQGLWSQVEQMISGYYFLLDTLGAYPLGAEAFLIAMSKAKKKQILASLSARAGYFQLRLGHGAEAKRLLSQSLHLFGQHLRAEDAGFASHYLGVLAHIAGDYTKAQQHYQQALDYFKQIDDSKLQSSSQNNLGILANDLGHHEEAVHWFQLALVSARKTNSLRGIAGALVNLGVSMENLGRLEQAKTYYLESLGVYREVGDVRGEAASLTNLGHLSERYKNYAEAKHYYEQSLILKRNLGDPIITAISLTNLADVAFALGQHEQALRILEEALELCQQAQSLPKALRVIWSYAKIHAAHHRWELALYLSMFLQDATEGEVWVQEEASQAIESWKHHVSKQKLSSLEKKARQADLEQIVKALQNCS